MAVKSAGLDTRLAMPGLTVILALVAFWVGTRRGGAVSEPKSLTVSLALTALIVGVAFWLGACNPSLFGSLPIIGKATD